MIIYYLKIAVRNLLKYKTQNVISVLGLAVGILCFTICMYCVRFVTSNNSCFKHHKRIVKMALCDQIGIEFSGVPVSLSNEVRSWGLNEIEAVACVVYPRERSYYAEIESEKLLPYDLETIEVDTFYNQVFTPRIMFGSWKTASHTPNAIIMAESTATRIFGSPEEAIGKRMILTHRLPTSPQSTPKDGGISYVIQAIMEDIPLNNSLNMMIHTDMLVVNDSEGRLQAPKREGVTGTDLYILHNSRTNRNGLLAALEKRNFTYTLFGMDLRLSPSSSQKKGTYVLVGITGGIGTLVLLIGLLNFFHFFIGSFFNRQREYSLQRLLGSNRRQLFMQLFIQSILIIGIVVLLMFWGFELIGNHLNFSVQKISMVFSIAILMKHTLQYAMGLLILCALICLMVTWYTRRMTVAEGVFGGRKRNGKRRGRNLMLGIQFLICWLFIGMTVAFYLQSQKTSQSLLHTLSTKEKSEILSIPLDYSFMKNEEKLVMVERFKQHSGVKDVMLSDVAYTQGVSGNWLTTEIGNDAAAFEANVVCVPKNFFSFMNIPIEQGRSIQTEQDVIADRVFQQLKNKDIIGMNLSPDNQNSYTVCAVCAPYTNNVYDGSPGTVFFPFNPEVYVGHCYLKCQPDQVAEVRQWVEKVCSEMLPESVTPTIYTLLNEIHERQALEYNLKEILLFLAIVCICITLLGVYSSITLDTTRRQKEVAIRKVNGANFSKIVWLFVWLYIKLLVFSAIVAFPIIYMFLVLWKRMYTVFFNHGVFFWLFIFTSVTLVTAFTIFFRIWKTARLNPAEIIKKE